MGDVHQLSDDDPGGRSQELAALLSAFGVRMHLGRPTLRFLRWVLRFREMRKAHAGAAGQAATAHAFQLQHQDSFSETAFRHCIIEILA
jgi:hypothetical protein